MDESAAVPLSPEDKEKLLRVAREAIETYLTEGKPGRFTADSDALLEPRAVFVTLRRGRDGKLRGCRGECHPRSSIVDAVARMAVASATDDSRFPSVTLEEMPELDHATPIKNDNREQRCQVNQHLEGDARHVNTQQRLRQHEVPRARHRKELGEPLHDAERDRFQKAHAHRRGLTCREPPRRTPRTSI